MKVKFPALKALVAAATEHDPDLAAVFAGLDRIDELGKDELGQLKTSLRDVAERLRDAERSNETVETLQDTAAAVGEITAAEKVIEQRDALAASLVASIFDTETDTAAPDATPARPALGQVQSPAGRSPRRPASAQRLARQNARQSVTITAGGHREAQSFREIAEQAAKTLTRGPQDRVVIASADTTFPEERRLDPNDVSGNDARLAAAQRTEAGALVAAGGICAPLGVDYSVPDWFTMERPLRDGLVRFGADRGGVVFTPPVALADVASAVGIWTEAVDANPSGATKAVLDVDCPDTTTVTVDAFPARLRFGNMQGQFDPERVEANLRATMATAARLAESELWARIAAASTNLSAGQVTGATRDVLSTIDRAVAALRYSGRMSPKQVVRIILGGWVRDMIRADLAKQLATDNSTGDGGALAVTDAQIDDWFSKRSIVPIWMLDGVAAGGAGGTAWPFQGFTVPGAGVLEAWPTKVAMTLFAEGTWQHLDGGTLNLGVVRDSTLNATNRYEMFQETFENVAKRGSVSLHVSLTTSPTGASSGTVTPA